MNKLIDAAFDQLMNCKRDGLIPLHFIVNERTLLTMRKYATSDNPVQIELSRGVGIMRLFDLRINVCSAVKDDTIELVIRKSNPNAEH